MMFASDQNASISIECPYFVQVPALPGNETFDYSPYNVDADLQIRFVNPLGISILGTVASPPAGITAAKVSGKIVQLLVPSAAFTTEGTYTIIAEYAPGGIVDNEAKTTLASWQWGGVADDIQLARKYLTNRIEADFTTDPTAPVLTVYDDDDIAVLGTRTAQNANGSAVSENQITNLSQLTP